MRGYCVHFAHATVYMLRSLGIPSRIATGYLTDMSQAIDGHILLRMSDRHAWAEVYIRGKGWVPFDTQPEKVESHAETQVDMKLLEELMGMLDPGEEILPDKTLDGEKNVYEEVRVWYPRPEYLAAGLVLVFLFFILIKIYLRYGWILRSSPEGKLSSSYLAVASILCDLGFKRLPGETRAEFKKRILSKMGAGNFSLTESLNFLNYSPVFNVDSQSINNLRRNDLGSFKTLSFKSKLRSVLNPSSIIAFITGHRW
jgi:hypothetical protein